MKTTRQFVITGASRGIGLELTRQVLERGDQVAVLVRNPGSAASLQELAKQHGSRLRIIKADVTSEADTRLAAQELGSMTVDVLINNAGAYLDRDADFEELPMESVLETMAVNAVSPMRVTRAMLPLMQRSKSPKLINISSLMGSIGDNGSGGAYAYRMSKVALNMFTRSFAHDYPLIVTLTMHPGWVRTDMGGASAPVEIPDSVAGLLKVIDGAGKKESGRFYDFEGEELPW